MRKQSHPQSESSGGVCFPVTNVPTARQVAVLFARRDSVYKDLENVDVWDADRDARLWPGGNPVVAHPPCRGWARLRMQAKPRLDELDLARFAVAAVRRFGGVVEHPASSSLWPHLGLSTPRRLSQNSPAGDRFGFTISVHQWWFGHKAAKATWLYIVGCDPGQVPVVPLRLGEPDYAVTGLKSKSGWWKKEISKAEREHTPAGFATWLIELARRCDR